VLPRLACAACVLGLLDRARAAPCACSNGCAGAASSADGCDKRAGFAACLDARRCRSRLRGLPTHASHARRFFHYACEASCMGHASSLACDDTAIAFRACDAPQGRGAADTAVLQEAQAARAHERALAPGRAAATSRLLRPLTSLATRVLFFMVDTA